MLVFHASHAEGTRRGTVIQGRPQPLVFAFVVCVQGPREQLEVVGNRL